VNIVQSLLAAAPPTLLLLAGLIPSTWANRHVNLMRTLGLGITSLALAFAIATASLLAWHGPSDVALIRLTWPLQLSFGVYIDSLSAVMLLLISFIGVIITRYSISYLDREATQGQFLRWMLFSLGAVQLLVVSRDLVMLTSAWMLTSAGLHRLLNHYPDRTWAVWAARKKFLISRLGDLMLLAALWLTYYCFGTTQYAEIFAAAQKLHESSAGGDFWISAIGSLYVLGAMTKSAQFPFHSWLPDTMETPTPVSALMHAGIINAGGFLVLRLSPLISLSHLALDFLALIGAFTALFGGLVMLTQTSVKRQLAYSTMAQMGFMMLQCGLGAFSAALLHIVAHSLYKAHAFLSCGSVLDAAARTKTDGGRLDPSRRIPLMLPAAIMLAIAICSTTVWIFGVDLASKPGAIILSLILSIALTQLIWSALSIGSTRLAVWGILAAALVSVGYYGAYLVADQILLHSVSHQTITPSLLDSLVILIVALGFIGIFLLQAAAVSGWSHPLFRSLYVHALNGFYLDVPARRITARIYGYSSPVQ